MSTWSTGHCIGCEMCRHYANSLHFSRDFRCNHISAHAINTSHGSMAHSWTLASNGKWVKKSFDRLSGSLTQPFSHHGLVRATRCDRHTQTLPATCWKEFRLFKCACQKTQVGIYTADEIANTRQANDDDDVNKLAIAANGFHDA